jgi:hypothetical protein
MRPHRHTSRLRRAGRPWKALLLVTCATAMSAAGASAAFAASDIEGVWSFNGGEVAVHAGPHGAFEGVVVTPTKFAQCVHPVGETMWTNITPQADGSYSGLHQWFFEGCSPNPKLGPTAWRVLQANDGHFLEVCFSEPGKPQPTISPTGTSTNASYGCVDSELIAPLPVTEGKGSEGKGSTDGSGEHVGIKNAAILPKATQCVKHSSLKIKLREPKHDPLKEVLVEINGKKVTDIRGASKLKHDITLTGLPHGSFTVKVVARTVLDQTLSGQLTYHSCSKNSDTISLQHRGKGPRHNGKGVGRHGKGKK